MTTTTMLDLNHTADELIHAVHMYNVYRNHPFPLCDDEAHVVVMASVNETDVMEPLHRFVEAVGCADWDDANIFEGRVRSAWLRTVAALNEEDDVVLEDEEEITDDLYDEELSVEDLTTKARSVIHGNVARRQFKQLLEDAEFMDASDEELSEALSYVVETGGLVKPMENFLLHEREEAEDWEEEAEDWDREAEDWEEEEDLFDLIDVERGAELGWKLLLQ